MCVSIPNCFWPLNVHIAYKNPTSIINMSLCVFDILNFLNTVASPDITPSTLTIMFPRNPDGRWARRRQEGDETTTSRRPHIRPTRSTRQAPQRIEINSDDDDEVQFQSSRRIRGIENGLLVNRLQQPPPAPPIQPPARQLPTRVFSIADGLRFLSDSMPSRSGLEGIDARIRQRYQQLDIPLHTIGFGGVFHPQFVQQPKKHYSVKASHPKKWPGFSSNAGPNIRHRKLIDSGKSSRQLVINGEGDRALYALRCGHLIDGRTYKELVESNILPKKRKTSKTKYVFSCPVKNCSTEHSQEPGLDALRLWT